MLFAANTPGGRWIVLDGDRDPPTDRRGGPPFIFICRISGMAGASDLKFCVLIDGDGP